MRTRTLVPACLTAVGAALATTAGAALPATAATEAPSTAPVIAGLSDGQTVSDTTPVTATSTAPYVLFSFLPAGATTAVATTVQPTAAGVASYAWDTHGFDGPVAVQAFDCASDQGDSCATDPATVTPTVDNRVAWDAPTEPMEVNPAENPLSVTVDDTHPGGTLGLHWTGAAGGEVQDVTAGTPTTVAFPDVDHGAGVLRLTRCSSSWATVCSPAVDDSAVVTMRRRFVPELRTLGGSPVSPNGDGARDTMSGALWAEPGTTSATWSVLGADGQQVGDEAPITLSPDADGVTWFTVDPTRVHQTLATGRYTLRVQTQGQEGGRDFSGTAQRAFELDLTPYTVTRLTRTLSRFYPVKDGYRDTIAFTPSLGPDHQVPAKVEFIGATGRAVRTLSGATLVDGSPFTWTGRNASGDLVPAGDYRVRISTVDDAGNTSTFTSTAFTLSHQRLVEKAWTGTLSAEGSWVGQENGSCSSTRHPGLRGWNGSVGYYSQSRCTGRDDRSRLAVGIHGMTLPKALSISDIRLQVYGGATRAGTDSWGSVNWFDNAGNILSRTYGTGPKATWHFGGAPAAGRVLWDDHRTIYWAMVVGSGDRYDVALYRVHATLHVLR